MFGITSQRGFGVSGCELVGFRAGFMQWKCAPVYGQTFDSSVEAQASIDSGNVELGEPVYVEDEEKWYVNVEGSAVPVYYDDPDAFQEDIDAGKIPDGATTYTGIVNPLDGSTYYVPTTNEGGTATPIATAIPSAGCSGTLASGDNVNKTTVSTQAVEPGLGGTLSDSGDIR